MPIKISSKMKKMLPEAQRDGIEDFLWIKSGGVCFLCADTLNKSSDSIEADHDVPESNGGKTDRDNLNLVHVKCNRFKRNNPSITVRPYLRFHAFLEASRFDVQYEKAQEFFNIKPVEVDYEIKKDNIISFHLPGTIKEINIYNEKVGKENIEFIFIEVPREVIWNDSECQPRNIKSKQILSIYSDILTNPLHEPPGCRLKETSNGYKILMFDGQHKTVASWLAGRDRIAIKIYLNFSKNQAIRLVNSVQSRIKKLPLSSFELASKFEEEWSSRYESYISNVGEEDSSELGFLDWIEKDEKKRAKSALEAALIKSVIENPDLAIKEYIESTGESNKDIPLIKETSFQNKVVKKLINLKPREEKGEDGKIIRQRELSYIINIINSFARLTYDPNGGGELSPQQIERRKRLTYQASLQYFSQTIKTAVAHLLVTDRENAFIHQEPAPEIINNVSEMIEKFVGHPIWQSKLEGTKKLNDVDSALTRNQDAAKVFAAVGLNVGYLRATDELPSDWSDD
ncbi:HNH endonuclease signature motif containing protein [Cobetia sp. 3AK]|uniref:HNH endonuclease n=1 Tax=Cobetia sp. 3AK TaxID=3040020 RepID=UPI00244B9569|nr:HNH endonuclease signature motif containing protein [Cobetia sp. 3AK]MDH2375010.1 HNH endonuclease signature motif containing protein [Cobetia sp. 3AK]